jgi:hypothetical protein
MFVAYFPDYLYRSYPYLFFCKYLLPIFRAPYQMVYRVVDRMTRPLQSHASFYTTARMGLCGLGSLPVSLITLWARHAFIPVASHGAFCKAFRNFIIFLQTLIQFQPLELLSSGGTGWLNKESHESAVISQEIQWSRDE